VGECPGHFGDHVPETFETCAQQLAFVVPGAVVIAGNLRSLAQVVDFAEEPAGRVVYLCVPNELIANGVIHRARWTSRTWVNQLVAESAGRQVDPDDLATISRYITETVRRFGEWVLDITPT
jgi:hypothetical protein